MSRPEDGATFEVSRVRSGRGSRWLAAAVMVAVGGLIALGTLDPGAAPEAAPAALATVEAPTPHPLMGRSSRPPARGPIASGSSQGRAVLVGDVIRIDLQPAGRRLFVHGDVFSLRVSRVVVSIEDGSGEVAAASSIPIQGGSTAFRLGPNARFDTHFDAPHELTAARVWVRADAYDSAGRILEAVLEPMLASPVGYQLTRQTRGLSDVWTRFDE